MKDKIKNWAKANPKLAGVLVIILLMAIAAAVTA